MTSKVKSIFQLFCLKSGKQKCLFFKHNTLVKLQGDWETYSTQFPMMSSKLVEWCQDC